MKKVVVAVAALPVVLVLLVVLLVVLLLTGGRSSAVSGDGSALLDYGPLSPGETVDGVPLSGDQLRNARIIVTVAQHDQLPLRAAVIAVVTAMRESGLRDLGYGDLDSLGLFQQRPSAGWGTPQQIMDPVYAANTFLSHLVRVAGWQTMPLTNAAQDVQNSGFPGAYAQWEPLADRLVGAYAGAGVCGMPPTETLRSSPLDPMRYPWPDVDPHTYIDDGHGYYEGECTSFAAWAVRNDGLHHVMVPDGLGDAYQWHGAATEYVPHVGDVAQWDPWRGGATGAGHVAYVSRVYGDGTIQIEEFNYRTAANNYTGHRYGTRRISASDPSRYLVF